MPPLGLEPLARSILCFACGFHHIGITLWTLWTRTQHVFVLGVSLRFATSPRFFSTCYDITTLHALSSPPHHVTPHHTGLISRINIGLKITVASRRPFISLFITHPSCPIDHTPASNLETTLVSHNHPFSKSSNTTRPNIHPPCPHTSVRPSICEFNSSLVENPK